MSILVRCPYFRSKIASKNLLRKRFKWCPNQRGVLISGVSLERGSLIVPLKQEEEEEEEEEGEEDVDTAGTEPKVKAPESCLDERLQASDTRPAIALFTFLFRVPQVSTKFTLFVYKHV